MKTLSLHSAVAALLVCHSLAAPEPKPESSILFEGFPNLDNAATGRWWERRFPANKAYQLMVPRDQVVAFAVYTHDRGVLKLTAQLYPLLPEETQEVRLELKRDGEWRTAATESVVYPGWSAHFRVPSWDSSRAVPYRVRHGEKALFEGTIRASTPKDELVVAVMSCNSSRTSGPRPEIVDHLIRQDPDLLFFAGDQSYHHTQHTAGWLEFGVQFRDVMRDRPVVTIPDDHDVGHPNLWGENGKRSLKQTGADGGYYFPAAYVKMVERQQTWHLPDPVDPAPVQQGIGVYFTRYVLGGVDFAILEDRKFKSGPLGKIPQMGPRPDHINDPAYRRESIDLPGLELLGKRQLDFLNRWALDWSGSDCKVVLSQTAFCGAVHMHGGADDRLLADLDCNGWPQTGRNEAVKALRRVRAIHLCGDQHLAVVVKHGIAAFGDGPYAFTSPALVNTIYGRWWHPEDEKPGPNAVPGSPLPWTGDYEDGLGNKLTMLAYANPTDVRDEKQRADGYGLARIRRKAGTVTFECWPRFSDKASGDKGQFPGWPLTVRIEDNDGRKPAAWLPTLKVMGCDTPVVAVIDEATGEIVHARRSASATVPLPVFAPGRYTVKVGRDVADQFTRSGLTAQPADPGELEVNLAP